MAENYEDRAARWWVKLNLWEWPDDLGPKPSGDSRMAIKGAFAVVEAMCRKNRRIKQKAMNRWKQHIERQA